MIRPRTLPSRTVSVTSPATSPERSAILPRQAKSPARRISTSTRPTRHPRPAAGGRRRASGPPSGEIGDPAAPGEVARPPHFDIHPVDEDLLAVQERESEPPLVQGGEIEPHRLLPAGQEPVGRSRSVLVDEAEHLPNGRSVIGKERGGRGEEGEQQKKKKRTAPAGHGPHGSLLSS